MCTDLGAANHYNIEHLQSPKIWAHAEAAELFYVGGYHLTVSPEAALALGAEAAKRNVPFVFGMGAPFIAYAFQDALDKVWEYTDYTFGNETEATAWAEVHGLETKTTSADDIKAIAKAMALYSKKNEKRARTCVITQGTEPTVVAVADGKGGVEVKEFPVHVIAKSEIVDTTGAGDAFAGGFLAGLVEGKGLDVCVDMGMWLAAKGLRELGPRYVRFLVYRCVVVLWCCDVLYGNLARRARHPIRKRQSKHKETNPKHVKLDSLLSLFSAQENKAYILTTQLTHNFQLPLPKTILPTHFLLHLSSDLNCLQHPCPSTLLRPRFHPQTKKGYLHFQGVPARP